jgi:hypothetical protein
MSDTPPAPRWANTARGYNGKRRKAKPAKPARPAKPVVRVFTALPPAELGQVLNENGRWAGTERDEHGHYPLGNPGSPGCGPNGARPGMETLIRREQTKIKRTLKQIIAEDLPGSRERVLGVLLDITEDKEQAAAARIAAAREYLNRSDGKPKESKTIHRTGSSGPSINVAMFGADGAKILEAVQSPEDRQRLAAAIHEWQQLEQPGGSSDRQEDGAEMGIGCDILVQGGDEA